MGKLTLITIAMMLQQTLMTFSTNAIPTLLPPISEYFSVNPGLLSAFTTILYAVGISVATLSSGAVIRFGAFQVSQFCLVAGAVGLLLCAAGWLWLFPLAAMFLGLGMGPSTPASSHILSRFSSDRNAPLVFSIKQTGVPFGGMIAGIFFPLAVIWVGWQGGLVIGAAACLVLALALWPMHARFDDDRDPARKISAADIAAALRSVKTSRSMAELGLAGFAFSGLQVAFTSYFIVYLVDDIGMDYANAGQMLAIASAVAIAGRIFWGAIAGRLVSPRHLLTFLAWTMTGATLLIAYIGPGTSLLTIMIYGLIMGFTAASWNGVHLAEVARVAPAGTASVATAGIVFCCFAGLLTLPGMFGLIVGFGGSYDSAFLASAFPAAVTGVLLLRKAETAPAAPAEASGQP